ncbi:MAG: Dna2/Cas4 domain-containing protein [Methanobrevibacter sp.]|jgi:CRISPR/Cas system-associated exonuclease Cas4 (RecB family)|nr:Dna2/Cas4 domain-containing protein [Candidatus Methanoflexus mossambicus]
MVENKIIDFNFDYNYKKHPDIKGLHIVNGKNNFPISWLNQQGYCEYTLYLQYFKDIPTVSTKAMVEGTKEHRILDEKFKENASPGTFEDILISSKKKKAISREVFITSQEYGIRGFIDELWMTPKEFVIIDDKPGTIAYPSSINQISAYALVFKDIIHINEIKDKRKIKIALRERGKDNIFWLEEFDENMEENIKFLINRMHGLFNGIKPFIPTKNGNKCKPCRFNSYCEHCLL